MKKIQDGILKIVITLACVYFLSIPAVALSKEGNMAVPDAATISAASTLAKADSLFHLKQYTESFELYYKLFLYQRYSPSMLLKMAYIQEGLGHLAQSMYYLNLYYIVTHDLQALNKIEEVAIKNKLEGYNDSESVPLFTLLKENYAQVALAIASVCLFLLALSYYQKIKRNRTPVVPGAFLVFFLALLFVHSYFSVSPAEGIISMPTTYLMEGPSAGSSVVSIVGEGHRLEILGKKDVWLKVKWINKEVYVKENQILTVKI